MGWGISIPALGIDTREGKYFGGSGGPKIDIGGDVGKVLTNASREANTPLGRTIIGGAMFGSTGALAGILPSLMNPDVEKYNPTDFSGITSRWDKITNGFTGEGMQRALEQQKAQSDLGVNNALASLGQTGGQSVGAADRLKRQSMWKNAASQAATLQDAELSKAMSQQQGVMGLDLPVAMGKDQAAAQAEASRMKAGASRWGTIGSLVGAGVGFAVGGPAGAAAGANLVGGLGSNLGSRYG